MDLKKGKLTIVGLRLKFKKIQEMFGINVFRSMEETPGTKVVIEREIISDCVLQAQVLSICSLCKQYIQMLKENFV